MKRHAYTSPSVALHIVTKYIVNPVSLYGSAYSERASVCSGVTHCNPSRSRIASCRVHKLTQSVPHVVLKKLFALK